MKVFRSKRKLKVLLNSLGEKMPSIGLVPTMGALHKGHVSLVKKAVYDNSEVVVSIFVNPTQFNNKEDFHRYPKTFEKDIELLATISDNLIVFAPTVSEMYGKDITFRKFQFDGLDKVMEGTFRKGHFDGVATVVETLLSIVNPQRAYFGEKDFQQLQIIKKIVAKSSLPVEIIGCPIIREPGGLAMSSRNERLSEPLRKEAQFIYKTLQNAKEKFGTKSANYVSNWVQKMFEKQPNLELEYIQIADSETLTPVLKKQAGRKYRAFVAVYADGIRLIDNIALN